VAFDTALEVVFSLTELVGAATEVVAFLEAVIAGTDIVEAAAHAADPSRKHRFGKTAEVEKFGAALFVVFSNTELVRAEAY
jgi:hypothetical protein